MYIDGNDNDTDEKKDAEPTGGPEAGNYNHDIPVPGDEDNVVPNSQQ